MKHSVPATGQPQAVDWRVRLLFPLGFVLLSLLARSWRVTIRNREAFARLDAAHKGWVLALWHGDLLPLVFKHPRRGMAVVVSEHRDGEVISRVLHALGHTTIRGSTTRGGGRALLAMIHELEAGTPVAVTPDGPRGPALKFQPGALVAAHRSGTPVITLALHADRAWRLRSWDAFVIPKPFARVTLAYGEPTPVHGSNAREAAAQSERFEVMMGETTAAAHA